MTTTFDDVMKRYRDEFLSESEKGDFAAFVKAGRKLGDLHCGYESAKPWKECVVDVAPVQGTLRASASLRENSPYRVTKMRFAKKDGTKDDDRNRILYNDRITIRGIPLAAYDYVVNGKSAIEWVMDRYQITTNKDSGIVNAPNLWLAESNNPRYIVDLLLKVITVSMEPQKIGAHLRFSP
ncbi:MAG: hypothetical protein IJR99_16820 [Kiritimatiellae bacterium]|nr:hypothetical protein [Kiritimatiellia bacterium]